MLITSLSPWIPFNSCSPEKKLDAPQDKQVVQSPVPEFDARYAMSMVETQVHFGARVPNSKAHALCKEFLVSELNKYCDTVLTQSFVQNVYGINWQLSNIIGRIKPLAPTRIMLCAHWDSRPRSDEDTLKSNYTKGIPAANDGASGVAVLLSLAKNFHQQKPEVGIDIVLFDGEDIGYKSDGANFCIGSQYFARNLITNVAPRYAILLDMVGDKNARFKIEQSSLESARPVVEKLWSLGRKLSPELFSDQVGGSITDDHQPLIAVGIPAVDIIDMDLIGNGDPNPRRRYWHTQDDVVANLSESTLGGVGKVLLELIYTNPIVM